MRPTAQTPQLVDARVKRLDNHRIFRPEAVEAYTTRRAGEAWTSRIRLEGWIIAGLTVLAATAIAFLFMGGR
jgi:hypothetical protein